MSRREARLMDPQQRHLLMSCVEALAHAGIADPAAGRWGSSPGAARTPTSRTCCARPTRRRCRTTSSSPSTTTRTSSPRRRRTTWADRPGVHRAGGLRQFAGRRARGHRHAAAGRRRGDAGGRVLVDPGSPAATATGRSTSSPRRALPPVQRRRGRHRRRQRVGVVVLSRCGWRAATATPSTRCSPARRSTTTARTSSVTARRRWPDSAR
ncbi:beta-ketoacyl synthase N-terminal-like domain-containing protein [Streptomyces sp. M19]